jgi:hypothetical protein
MSPEGHVVARHGEKVRNRFQVGHSPGFFHKKRGISRDSRCKFSLRSVEYIWCCYVCSQVLGGAVGGAREILTNVVGKRGHPGSCALEALPNVQEGHVVTGWDRGPWWPLSLGRNNCECLDDQFVIVRERRGRFG